MARLQKQISMLLILIETAAWQKSKTQFTLKNIILSGTHLQ